MSVPLLDVARRLMSAPARSHVFKLWRRELVGIVQDYWKDGDGTRSAPPSSFASMVDRAGDDHSEPAPPLKDQDKNLWHAEPGELSEKMWGAGYVTPGDIYFTDALIRPLGLTKDMNVLDLSAGLGGRMRKATDEYGVYINGREPDPEIAARGMAISVAAGRGKHAAITAYDPMKLVEQHKYDCVIARETIYRVPDKALFIKSIVSCCKPKAQISFTDFVVNPEARDQPAIKAWQAFEKGANPCSLVEMAELWAKAGINIRVHDDQTDYYQKEVKAGLLRFTTFLASGVQPDAATKKALLKRVMTWSHRMAALQQGMKLYRFYGIR